jgi:hypothetical protein
MGIDEELYDVVGYDFFGEPCSVAGIPSCEGCAYIANECDGAEEMIASLRERQDQQ